MQVYNERIGEIERAAGDVVAFLQSKRNTFVSLFRLPPEVICEIFLCLHLKGRLRLSWTSSYLRQVSLASPPIWADLDFSNNSPNLLRCLLDRSANAPLTLRQGTSQQNTMRSVTRPTRYTKYESTVDGPRSAPLEWELSTLLARTEALDLSSSFSMSTSPLGFISPACFDRPMPQLVTLHLRASTLSYRSPLTPATEKHWFAGQTPRLRHICFHRLLAPWDDPIYRNLVSLALHYPSEPIAPPALADVLARSPLLQELVLQGALEPGPEDARAPVALPHLARLHVEINRSGFDRDGGSRVIRLFLALIRPGPHCRLHIETNDLGALPASPAFAGVLQHTDALRIAAVRNRIELHACRDVDVLWSYIASYDTLSLGEFDTPDFRAPALLAALLHVADRAGVPWARITALSVSISDRGIEGLGARPTPPPPHAHPHAHGPPAARPPYFGFFTGLFARCAHVRRLVLATTNPTAVLVNTLGTACGALAELSIEGTIRDPLLLALWVQERCGGSPSPSPEQGARMARLVVKHRGDYEARDRPFGEYVELRCDDVAYEVLRDDAKASLRALVPEFEWQDLPPDHREAVISWRDSWDDVEFIL